MDPITSAILLREASATTRMSLGRRVVAGLLGVDLHDGERVSDKLTGGTSYYTPLPTPEELIDWMAQVEMAPEALAARLEVPIKYVDEILTGQTEMPTHTWFALGKIIGMTNQERSVIAQRNYAVAPGEYVNEWLEESETTAPDLAFKLGVSESYVHALLAGEIPVSDALADALATLTGIPVKSWRAFEEMYQKDKARLAGVDLHEAEPLVHRIADER